MLSLTARATDAFPEPDPMPAPTSDTASYDADEALDVPLGDPLVAEGDMPLLHPLATAQAQSLAAQLIADGHATDVRSALRQMTQRVGTTVRADGTIITHDDVIWNGAYHHAAPPHATNTAGALHIGPGVVEALAADGTTKLHISFFAPATWSTPIFDHLGEEILAGELTTVAGYEARKTELVEARRTEGEAIATPLADLLVAAGVEDAMVNGLTPSMVATVPHTAWDQLTADLSVQRVDLFTAADDDLDQACGIDNTGNGSTSLDGAELEDLLQTEQFYDAGYYGKDVRVGISEPGAARVLRRHPGFHDSTNADRYRNCRPPLCSNFNTDDITEGNPHATAVASIAIGDITGGQHSSNFAAGSLGATKRSGVARRAEAFGVNAYSNPTFGIPKLTSNPHRVHIVSQSASVPGADLNCTGAGTISRDWNAVYESGIAVFNSTGNNGRDDAQDCQANAPSTAMGVFSVNQHSYDSAGVPTLAGTDATRGGTSTEGRGHTLVDLAAPEPVRYPYPHYDRPTKQNGTTPIYYGSDFGGLANGDPDGIGNDPMCCSSAATPMVSGAAALYREWFLSTHGMLIDEPGLLYTSLLLMGDRRAGIGTGVKIDSGFDNLWGAGTLKLRLPTQAGLDSPSGFSSGKVFIGQGQEININLDVVRFGTDPDIIKAVAWYYDPRHDDGPLTTTIDIDLALQSADDPTASWTTRRSDLGADHKKRVFYDGPMDFYWRLQLQGTLVDVFDPVPVYWAYFWEDSDRESGEVPDCVEEEG